MKDVKEALKRNVKISYLRNLLKKYLFHIDFLIPQSYDCNKLRMVSFLLGKTHTWEWVPEAMRNHLGC